MNKPKPMEILDQAVDALRATSAGRDVGLTYAEAAEMASAVIKLSAPTRKVTVKLIFGRDDVDLVNFIGTLGETLRTAQRQAGYGVRPKLSWPLLSSEDPENTHVLVDVTWDAPERSE